MFDFIWTNKYKNGKIIFTNNLIEVEFIPLIFQFFASYL